MLIFLAYRKLSCGGWPDPAITALSPYVAKKKPLAVLFVPASGFSSSRMVFRCTTAFHLVS
ncbi:hypothetical protein [Brevibacillus parabrevis]|uniref:hypothetical protein n=1 Tax=Brevibacillus parabrevis TaxID=54914 RepID=UPI0028CFEA23|nr:hypothetical protein [Brevibacillus parabrevis]